MGGRSASSGFRAEAPAAEERISAPLATYDRFPTGAIMFSGAVATAEDKAKVRAIRKAFMADAAVGNVYKYGAAFGTIPSEEGDFEIVEYRRSPNGMGIRSTRGGRPVALTTANLNKFIGGSGATLIRRRT